jgi:hypothetical protein
MNPRFMLHLVHIALSLAVCAVLSPIGLAIPLPDNSTTATSSTAFQITNTGSGKAGQFDLNNAANNAPALTATSNGTGYGFFSLMTGTGRGGYFQTNNASNTGYALGGVSNGKGYGVYGLMTGIGRAGHFEIANAGSGNAALSGTSNGTGYSLAGFMTGTGRAGYFQITNAGNSKAAIEATTNGSGSAVKGVAGTGLAGEFTGNVTATGTMLSGGSVGSSSGALELRVGGQRLYRLENATDTTYGYSPNLIGGFSGNEVTPGVVGATIGGGGAVENINQVNGVYGTVSGGENNTASGNDATVSGGIQNTASGGASTVSGGLNNAASSPLSTVSGGYNNTASATYSTVSGGYNNTASGNYSFVGGGQNNQASGDWSAVLGGGNNIAGGITAIALGTGAQAFHSGTLVFGDGSGSAVSSTTFEQITMRAANGFRFFTNPSMTTGVQLAPNGSQWLAVSDRNMKNYFRTLDPTVVLDKFSQIPITEWSYKAQDPSIRHIGPMAQDFFQAFGLGEDKLRIGTMDADGVMMAAIQGLNAKLKDKDREIDSLKSELSKQKAETETRLARLERLLTPKKTR